MTSEKPVASLGFLLLVLLLVGAAYRSVPSVGWSELDDRGFILTNPAVTGLGENAGWLVRPEFGGYWRPLTALSHAIEMRRFGLDPGPPHETQLGLHLVAVALVFALCRLARAGPIPAALGAALFGLAPRLSESVCWISERAGLLSSVFALAAVAVHAAWRERVGGRVAAAPLLLLGLLAKELAVCAFVAIAVMELRPSTAQVSSARRRLAPAIVVVGGYLGAYLAVFAAAPADGFGLGASPFPFASRLRFAFEGLGHHLRMIADPLHPTLYASSMAYYDTHALVFAIVGVVLLGFVSRWILRRDVPALPRAMAALGVMALLLVSLPPLSKAYPSTAYDRWLYLPLAAITVTAVSGASRWLKGSVAIAAVVVAAIVVGLFFQAASRRVDDWRDPERLFQRATSDGSPVALQPWMALALLACERGEEARARAVFLEGMERVDAAVGARGGADRHAPQFKEWLARGQASVRCLEDGGLAIDAPGGVTSFSPVTAGLAVPPPAPLPARDR